MTPAMDLLLPLATVAFGFWRCYRFGFRRGYDQGRLDERRAHLARLDGHIARFKEKTPAPGKPVTRNAGEHPVVKP